MVPDRRRRRLASVRAEWPRNRGFAVRRRGQLRLRPGTRRKTAAKIPTEVPTYLRYLEKQPAAERPNVARKDSLRSREAVLKARIRRATKGSKPVCKLLCLGGSRRLRVLSRPAQARSAPPSTQPRSIKSVMLPAVRPMPLVRHWGPGGFTAASQVLACLLFGTGGTDSSVLDQASTQYSVFPHCVQTWSRPQDS